MSKAYPLEVESVGLDTYICMSRGHHDLEVFMREAISQYPGYALGGPRQVWMKSVPCKGSYDTSYHEVPQGTRGCWPATYCWEYGEDWEKYNGCE